MLPGTRGSAQAQSSGASDRSVLKVLVVGSEAAMRGDWRRCADLYRQAYEISPTDSILRCNCISGFTSVLRENHFKATDADLNFLQKLFTDAGTSTMIRAQACSTRGLMLWLSHDPEGAKRSYRKAIALVEGASSEDRGHEQLMTTVGGLVLTSMGPLLDAVLKLTRESLAVLEGRSMPPGSGVSRGAQRTFQMTKFLILIGPNGNQAEADSLGEYFDTDANTKACNYCSAASSNLSQCARCKYAWFCSQKCQEAAWPAHKTDCRKEGLLEPGDLVKITNAPEKMRRRHAQAGELDPNGMIVEVIGQSAGQDAMKWDLCSLGVERIFSLPTFSFTFSMAVGRRHALLAGSSQSSNTSCEKPYSQRTDSSEGKDRLHAFVQGEVPAETCQKARAEGHTGKMRVEDGRTVICTRLVSSAVPGLQLWQSLDERRRLLLLEDIFQIWIEEHHPVEEKDDIDSDVFVSLTVGDLRPRLREGSRGKLLDMLALGLWPGGTPGLLGERLAMSAEALIYPFCSQLLLALTMQTLAGVLLTSVWKISCLRGWLRCQAILSLPCCLMSLACRLLKTSLPRRNSSTHCAK